MKRAFTLVELLVTIAIIAILAALLSPALRRARGSAKGAVCVNNLHQMGMAAQMYWNDYDGDPFAFSAGVSTNNGDVYWFGWIERGAEGSRKFDASAGVLYPYVRDSVKICPQLDYAMSAFKLKASGAAYGYGYNLHLAPMPAYPKVKIAQLARPAMTTVFADAAQLNTFQAPASPLRPMLEEFYYVSADEATAHFRHGKAAFVNFCDGHVDARKPAPGTLDMRLPVASVAQLAAEILRP